MFDNIVVTMDIFKLIEFGIGIVIGGISLIVLIVCSIVEERKNSGDND